MDLEEKNMNGSVALSIFLEVIYLRFMWLKEVTMPHIMSVGGD